jgi:hypothetical protein
MPVVHGEGLPERARGGKRSGRTRCLRTVVIEYS